MEQTACPAAAHSDGSKIHILSRVLIWKGKSLLEMLTHLMIKKKSVEA